MPAALFLLFSPHQSCRWRVPQPRPCPLQSAMLFREAEDVSSSFILPLPSRRLETGEGKPVCLSRIERWRSCFYNFYMNGNFRKLMSRYMARLLM